MDLTTLKSLQSKVNDPDLARAMAHPDWAASYEDTLENMEDDMPFREKDVDDEVTLAFVLTYYSFGVDEKHRIFCDTLRIGTDGCTWIDGEWVDSANTDDDES